MTKEEFLKTGLCEQYVLGLTSPEENELVKQMLKTYPELQKDCMGLEDCMGKYIEKCPITSLAKSKRNKARLKSIFPSWMIILTIGILLGLIFLWSIIRS